MNSIKIKLYYSLPYFIKNFFVSFVAYKNARIRRGNYYHKYLNELRKSWLYNEEQLYLLQSNKLSNLLIETLEYSTYYKKKFSAAGINKQDIVNNPANVLSRLPFLEKKDLKDCTDEIENKNPKRKRDVTNYTSGTTGTPLTVYYDKESVQMSFALWKRFHDTIGLPEKFNSVRFSGKTIIHPQATRPPYWVYNFIDKQLFMSSYHLSENRLPYYLKKINYFKPELIDGYPSAIYILSQYINSKRITLSFKPVAITTTAETLHSYQRAEIEKAFKCKVYNQYASSEGGAFITECKQGNYHVNTDSGYFEFFNFEGKPAMPGEYAELVITSFRNFKMPLIRYKSGDIVLLSQSNKHCTCGCNMPIVEEITGRLDDILYTKDKGYVGRMDTAYKGLTGIEKSQIIQRSPELIEIYQVINGSYNDEIEKMFLKNLHERLGQIVTIKLFAVDSIPLSKNGKFKTVIRDFKLPEFKKLK